MEDSKNNECGDVTQSINYMQVMEQVGEGIKLNIGCGNAPMAGFINVDPFEKDADVPWDAGALPLNDGKVALICSCMVVEHFPKHRLVPIFSEWYRVLKKGGKVWIQTTLITEVCRRTIELAENDLDVALGYIYGSQHRDGQTHYTGFTGHSMCRLLGAAGFPKTSIGLVPADWMGPGYVDMIALAEK
jgi:hypothetical protein